MAKKEEKNLPDLSSDMLRKMFAWYEKRRIRYYTEPKLELSVKGRLSAIIDLQTEMNEINRLLQFRGEPPEKFTLLSDLWDDPLVAADYVHFSKYM